MGLKSPALNLVACPRVDPNRISSVSVHFSHQLSRSPSASVAMMRPLDDKFSNAASGVFFILKNCRKNSQAGTNDEEKYSFEENPHHPNSVASTIYSLFENSDTGSTEVTTSSDFTGNTDGIGAPLAVLLPSGT